MNKTRLICLSLNLIFVSCVIFPSSVKAGIGINPAALSFGSVPVNTTSAAVSVVVTNPGRQTILISDVSSTLPEFIVISPTMPAALAPNGSAAFQVMFRPDAAVNFSGTLFFKTNRKNRDNQAITMSGTGTAAASSSTHTYSLSASPSTLSFGNIPVGSSTSMTITLTNSGTDNVSISQVVSGRAGFTISALPGAVTLPPGQTFSLPVGFAPAIIGTATGSLSIISSAANSPTTISLNGNGVQPQISVIPSNISFGGVTLGLTNTQALTISNPGTANLSITQMSLAGTGLSLSGPALPLTIPPGGASSIRIGFTPTSAGSYPGNLVLMNNTPNSPLSLAVTGTGIAPILQLTATPTSINLGNVTTGANVSQSVTLTNTGNSSISVSNISVTGSGFGGVGYLLPFTVAAGQSASFSVTCAPSTATSLSGNVTVTSNAANSPLVISLAALGIPASHSVMLNLTPNSSTSVGFNIYRGALPGGPYTKVNPATVSAMSYADASVASGQTYYYVATELGSTGAESLYSNEVNFTIP